MQNELTLLLFMAGVFFANNHYLAVPFNDFAIIAHGFY